MSELDTRLRTALSELGEAAADKVRPAEVAAVRAAGRRRLRANRAATGALAVVLAGGAATGWWLAGGQPAGERAASPGCVPARAVAFLPFDASDDLRARTGRVLVGSPEVDSPTYESRQLAYERFEDLYRDRPDLVESVKPDTLPDAWRFTVRCASDWPAVRDRLNALPGLALICSCTPGETVPAFPESGTSTR
jgi:hypothetical protein